MAEFSSYEVWIYGVHIDTFYLEDGLQYGETAWRLMTLHNVSMPWTYLRLVPEPPSAEEPHP